MKQPSVYSQSQIFDATFELIREQGWSGISTRAIAKKLGSSTMPIYSHVRSVEELEKELLTRSRSLLKDFQERPYTEHALLNLAFGYVAFARDEKHLFRFLYLERPNKVDLEDVSGAAFISLVVKGNSGRWKTKPAMPRKKAPINMYTNTETYLASTMRLLSTGKLFNKMSLLFFSSSILPVIRKK
ncbi:MAG: TetR/AcrR family transcriptional regulator [Bacillota bacterium]|nr:TetR/AcrR family transcriptional regulator [Bacillota bacterium]